MEILTVEVCRSLVGFSLCKEPGVSVYNTRHKHTGHKIRDENLVKFDK